MPTMAWKRRLGLRATKTVKRRPRCEDTGGRRESFVVECLCSEG